MTGSAPIGDVTPGVLGFLVVAALGIALFFLIKSMNKQISKIEVPHEADLDKADREAESGEGRRPEGTHDPKPNGA